MRHLLPILLLLGACKGDPRDQVTEVVDFRDGADGGPTSGERGTVKIQEILWSGSVRDDGTWDRTDVFIELRNESIRAVDVSTWRLVLEGPFEKTYRIPVGTPRIPVGGHLLLAAKTTGCFPDADAVIPDLAFPLEDGFELTLQDADERLIEPAGNAHMRPYAGGYDFVSSYSMERITLMFGVDGGQSHAWQFHNRRACPASVINSPEKAGLSCHEDIPNNDRVALGCRKHTLATPGRPNTQDYSGAYGAGGFD